MENSCNNRYELLFVDDESVVATIPPQQIPGPGKKKKETSVQSNSIKNEKENKINMLNKSTTKIGNQYTGPKGNISISNGIKELRTKNVRMTGSEKIHSNLSEYNNELPQRHIRDRDSKAPRFRGNEKFGKREFDRQSGSDKTAFFFITAIISSTIPDHIEGVKSVDKRDGAGAHNWGSAKQDIEELKSGNAATVGDKEDSANEQSGEPTNNLEDDESKQMTLDEWKALKDQRAKPNFNLRKAGEGVDNSEWKKMTVLSKKKEIGTEDELEYDPSMYPQRVGRIQRIVDIQFNFNDGRKTGFRKGPRAPARGGHHEESAANIGFEKIPSYKFAKQHRAGSKNLKVDDEIQFPTLS